MTLSLGQAAVAVGMSKPTIQRAIKNGKLSASRNEDGSYSIDESELARVYQDQWRNRYVTGTLKQDETPSIPEVLGRKLKDYGSKWPCFEMSVMICAGGLMLKQRSGGG